MLRIDYETLSGICSTRTVRPLSVTFFGPVWLLVAWCEAASDFRCFRLDRIGAMIATAGLSRMKLGSGWQISSA